MGNGVYKVLVDNGGVMGGLWVMGGLRGIVGNCVWGYRGNGRMEEWGYGGLGAMGL